ncbi:TPA: SMEK domain-containing protein [Klebsiella quasipneumoniae subsp. quasipneumoniae]
MLERQQQNQRLTQALAVLSTHISYNSQQSMLDINRVMEVILPTLLNQIYGLMLIDLNVIKHNHPAIDLGDSVKRISIQITADGSKSKMVDTLDKFIAHNLNIQYDTIWFLIISNDVKCSFTRQGFDLKVINLSDIAKYICALPQPQFETIYAFCEQQFRTYFSDNNVSVLAPVISPSQDPCPTIDNFMIANGIDVHDGYTTATVADIRNDLIDLKTKLSGLNDDQRWFIYQVMNWSMLHDDRPEYCAVPCSVIVSGKDMQGIRILHNTIDSLSSLRLAGFTEESWKYDSNIYWVNFQTKNFEEFDYFSGITEFLKKTSNTGLLKRVVVDCDFSVIN